MKTAPKYLLLICLLSFICSISRAQNNYIIKGVILDSLTKTGSSFSTLTLKDSAMRLVNTSQSKLDGSFVILSLPSGKYNLNLLKTGYISKVIPVLIGDKPVLNLDTILIQLQTTELAGVTIRGQKPIVKQELDRLIYDMQADPESKGNTVLEMMRKVPLLSVDGNDNVLLKGSDNFRVFINGKPSSMMERNLKDVLRNMPASSIKSIEVIHSPSAKYDAEGVGGIINIITNKSVDNGYNGSINLIERFPVGGPTLGSAFTFKQGKFGISLLGGAGRNNSPETRQVSDRSTSGTSASILNQTAFRKSETNTGYFGTDLSYELDSLNLISLQFNVNGNNKTGSDNQLSTLNNADGFLQRYAIENISSGTGKGTDAAFNYQRGFKSSKQRLLTFSYRFLANQNNQNNNTAISDTYNYEGLNFIQNNEGSYTEQTLQLDYVQPVKKLIIESGLKTIIRNNKSEFDYRSLDAISGKYEIEPLRSNNFRNDQVIYAAYNSYSFGIGSWGFRAGLRVEQTTVDANFSSSSSTVDQHYFSAIPSAGVNKKFTDNSSLSLTYIKRMQRPGITQLNPFIDRSNPNYEISGNPNLRPAFTNVIQLSYNKSKKTTLSITAAYMFINSLINTVTSYDESTNVTTTKFENMGKANIIRTNIYINHPFTKRFNVTFNTDIRYVKSAVVVSNVLIEKGNAMAYLNISGGYSFQNGLRLNSNLTMNTKNGVAQTTNNGYTALSFSMNKDIIKDKLTFSAQITNPFTKYRNVREEIYGPDFYQNSVNQIYYRTFGASLNYRFGKLKSQLKKNQRQINNDDSIN